MRFTLTIDCDNDAFQHTGPACMRETARILAEASERIRAESRNALHDPSGFGLKLRDVNGNTVGRFGFEDAREAEGVTTVRLTSTERAAILSKIGGEPGYYRLAEKIEGRPA